MIDPVNTKSPHLHPLFGMNGAKLSMNEMVGTQCFMKWVLAMPNITSHSLHAFHMGCSSA